MPIMSRTIRTKIGSLCFLLVNNNRNYGDGGATLSWGLQLRLKGDDGDAASDDEDADGTTAVVPRSSGKLSTPMKVGLAAAGIGAAALVTGLSVGFGVKNAKDDEIDELNATHTNEVKVKDVDLKETEGEKSSILKYIDANDFKDVTKSFGISSDLGCTDLVTDESLTPSFCVEQSYRTIDGKAVAQDGSNLTTGAKSLYVWDYEKKQIVDYTGSCLVGDTVSDACSPAPEPVIQYICDSVPELVKYFKTQCEDTARPRALYLIQPVSA